MAWRAPEFAVMTTKPTRKSDVYSLGTCIIEAVTGKNPWHGYSNDQIRDYLLNGVVKVDRPEGMPDAQWDLVKRMIALSPTDRPDLGRVITELTDFANQEVESECPYP
ncbi:hypothetical protein Poli38472_007923 [Pythium oligandrum]|uniref:Protein kinase domain-containing protein n=1 Tax=Pythium oligandrum TaxID=41045 RepID=A0A8K1FJT6_PYTOL|nr:hypothetical protein Poli38472_007923 [Pythium oligandrum]|eukprot:TMW65281.1 hypothetical protein Poli38472_007923 [Pythium oligandrum]